MSYVMRFSLMSIYCLTVLTLTSCEFFKKEEESPRLVVANVLDEKYYTDCHIKGSINIPMDQLETYAQKWDKENTEVIVYCSNYKCSASAESARILKKSGFKKVFAYEGGIAEWHNLGYPVDGTCTGNYGYMKDFAKPENYAPESDVPTIEAAALKEKIEKFLS